MIIVRLSGGMGNQMFQYALGRALSIKYSTELGLDLSALLDRTPRRNFTFRDYELDLFSINARIVSQSEIPYRHRLWGRGKIGFWINALKRKYWGGKGREKGFAFNPHVLSVGGTAYLDGYWQSYKYFESVSDTIRSDFKIRDPLPTHIQTLKQEIESKISVCIHIRRGDYVGNPLHDVLDYAYYVRAVQTLNQKTAIDHVYVFSNDPEWCKTSLHFDIPTTVVGDEYAGDRQIGHFALMQSCTHFIIANSSFSWWAAWLANTQEKIVIAPKKWFGDETIDTSNRIPVEWIRL